MFSYSPNFYQERLQRLVVRCISICRTVIRHLQGSKLTRDMMVMKAVTAWCCHVRSAAPEVQFPTEQRGSILYSFLLYPLHKIFSHLQNKKVRLGFSVSLIFHKNNKSVSAKFITGLSLSILSAEKGQNFFKLWCSF